jgi:hypothetical protein
MTALLRRLCTSLDAFYDRHPVLALGFAVLICFACVIGIESIGAVSPGINHIGGFA